MSRTDRVLGSVIEAIGDTPLVELARLTHGRPGRILAKLEYLNPGFSKKDRIARQMIDEAERDGTLGRGQTVVELTSGNTGTGLAIVCAVTGHPFVAVISRGNSAERARMMRALGAEVVLIDQAPGATPGQVSGHDLARVEEATRRIVGERDAFRADQFQLTANARAHALHTGPEILRQAGGAIHAFCDFVGTAGSFAGCAAAFKEHDRAIRCFVVEPAAAAALAGRPVTSPHHRIQGGGYALAELAMLRGVPIDGYVQVTDEQAIAAARRLAREEGIFAGFSAGANVAAALSLLDTTCAGQTIVVLVNDSGLKYLSTDLWP
ncbi:MAG: cysteine synthase family protein [Candidatus Rokubacteria bacterium]|nr:cysteine synthase family protein [Candidatus Rokubacteria bacterium]